MQKEPSRTAPTIATDDGFQRFYREQHATVVQLARMLTGEPHQAADLAQEAFLRLYRHRTTAKDPPALLRTITANVCKSWHRGRGRAQLRMVRHGATDVALAPFERELDHSLQRLPYGQRAVIVLRYWLGLTEAEIAESLGIRPGTVKSRHTRALRALKSALDEPPKELS